MTINDLRSQYGITKHNIQYLVWLVDKHGLDILRTTNNNYYPKDFKEDAIKRVLIDNEPIQTVAIDIGLLSDELLHNWIKKYKENGYNIVGRKQGRSTTAKEEKKMKLKMKRLKV